MASAAFKKELKSARESVTFDEHHDKNFGKRLSATKLQENVVQRKPSIVDLPTINPRGLPSDLKYVYGEYSIERKQSLQCPRDSRDEDARLLPFLPVRTASDQDNLHNLPPSTKQEADRHFIILVDPSNLQKEMNILMTEDMTKKAREFKAQVPLADPAQEDVKMPPVVEEKKEPEPDKLGAGDEAEKEPEKTEEELKKEEELKLLEEEKLADEKDDSSSSSDDSSSSSDDSSDSDDSSNDSSGSSSDSSGSSSSDSDSDFMMPNGMPFMQQGYGYGGGAGYYPQPPVYGPCATCPCPSKKLVCSKSKKGKKNIPKKNQGLNFDFLPHDHCCTEICLTIEPDEPDPLECAIDNGIMPIVCCYMPPSFTFDQNLPAGARLQNFCGPQTSSNNNNAGAGSKYQMGSWRSGYSSGYYSYPPASMKSNITRKSESIKSVGKNSSKDISEETLKESSQSGLIHDPRASQRSSPSVADIDVDEYLANYAAGEPRESLVVDSKNPRGSGAEGRPSLEARRKSRNSNSSAKARESFAIDANSAVEARTSLTGQRHSRNSNASGGKPRDSLGGADGNGMGRSSGQQQRHSRDSNSSAKVGEPLLTTDGPRTSLPRHRQSAEAEGRRQSGNNARTSAGEARTSLRTHRQSAEAEGRRQSGNNARTSAGEGRKSLPMDAEPRRESLRAQEPNNDANARKSAEARKSGRGSAEVPVRAHKSAMVAGEDHHHRHSHSTHYSILAPRKTIRPERRSTHFHHHSASTASSPLDI